MSIVSLGAHIVDVLAQHVDAWPDGQDTAVVDRIRMTPAGSAAGTAVGLAVLGREVRSLGAIGTDELGDFLLASMAAKGVDVREVVRRTDVQTSASMLPIRSNGERAAVHVAGANLTFGAGDVPEGALESARAVHVGGPDVCLGLPQEDFAQRLRRVRATGTLVTMDLLSGVPDLLRAATVLLPCVDYLLPNEEQILRMTGRTDVLEAARDLLALGANGVVVTLGAAGSLVVTAEEAVRILAIDVPVVDTTGCGDAYCAAFLIGLLDGSDPVGAARLGTAAAATVAGGLGSNAALTDLDSLRALTERIPHDQ
ncbi:carbohydrate kinase family protein [Amycolatopsis halotolerans]|uniref:Carbohydrate kinase family protein n=1 Tax=Amycolatopsis halotolerans TaxID=330083 RepID=A0ABV7QEQ5_9PSEU